MAFNLPFPSYAVQQLLNRSQHPLLGREIDLPVSSIMISAPDITLGTSAHGFSNGMPIANSSLYSQQKSSRGTPTTARYTTWEKQLAQLSSKLCFPPSTTTTNPHAQTIGSNDIDSLVGSNAMLSQTLRALTEIHTGTELLTPGVMDSSTFNLHRSPTDGHLTHSSPKSTDIKSTFRLPPTLSSPTILGNSVERKSSNTSPTMNNMATMAAAALSAGLKFPPMKRNIPKVDSTTELHVSQSSPSNASDYSNLVSTAAAAAFSYHQQLTSTSHRKASSLNRSNTAQPHPTYAPHQNSPALISMIGQTMDELSQLPDFRQASSSFMMLPPRNTNSNELGGSVVMDSSDANRPKVELVDQFLWDKFHAQGTEMVITKSGR